MKFNPTYRAFVACALALVLAGCSDEGTAPPTDPPATTPPTDQAIRDASTASELLSLGARQLSGDEIISELVGHTLDEGGWTWNINSDGTASSRADDDSWTSTSTWHISGDQYCRMSTGGSTTSCSDVYELGGIYRFSDSDNPGDLSGWAITAQTALTSAIDRNYESSTTTELPVGMTRVTEDPSQTPSGWSVTVDGETVRFAADDIVANNSGDDYYYKIDGNEEFVFWSAEEGGFAGDPSPEFDYLNVYGFAHADIAPGADFATYETTDYVRGSYVYIVDGTSASNMPVSGSATYNGRMEAREWPSDDAVFSAMSTHYRGDFGMTAAFDASGTTLMGEFTNLESDGDAPGSGTYTSIPGMYTFSPDVTGSRFSSTDASVVSGPFAGSQNINVRGAFYGPGAAEVGGSFGGENPTANTLFNGWFAGRSGQ